jgi:hypothetical protein
MKRTVKKNKSKIGIWTKIKNIFNESPWHAAFSYPFVFFFLFVIILILIEYIFIYLGINELLVSIYLGPLFFLIPIWILTGLIVSKRRLPYFICILITLVIFLVPYLAYESFTKSAKKNATQVLHAQAVKYISAEIQQCKTGKSRFMNKSQDCPATATKAVMGAVATMTDRNPFDTSKNAVREFNNNKDDKDVGFISLSVSGTTVVIRSCISKPCYDEKNRLQDSIEVQ